MDDTDSIDATRYALAKQAPAIGDIETEYGLLMLTGEEAGQVRKLVSKLLAQRLRRLENASN
ncbi:MAG: hypothetical protein VX796_16625 [Pseudomonadota bacterium]|nr:hypothetical protein [Pseudomonadota bacterium]